MQLCTWSLTTSSDEVNVCDVFCCSISFAIKWNLQCRQHSRLQNCSMLILFQLMLTVNPEHEPCYSKKIIQAWLILRSTFLLKEDLLSNKHFNLGFCFIFKMINNIVNLGFYLPLLSLSLGWFDPFPKVLWEAFGFTQWIFEINQRCFVLICVSGFLWAVCHSRCHARTFRIPMDKL